MSIIGLGIDILSLSRFQAVIARRGVERVARRVCSPGELVRYRGITSPLHAPGIGDAQLRFLSSRWAIKEAAYKALYPSLPLIRASYPDYHLTFTSFELAHSRGAPNLRVLAPTADGVADADDVPGVRLLATLSHDAGVVVGAVVAVKDP